MCVFINFFLEKHFQQMIDDGIVVEAEIYSCRQRHLRAPYASVYKYVDENGRKYIGRLKPIYKTKEEAETHIGETVEIYIDGKGKSIPVGEKPHIGRSLFWVIFSTILVCVDNVGIVIVSIKIHKNIKNCRDNKL